MSSSDKINDNLVKNSFLLYQQMKESSDVIYTKHVVQYVFCIFRETLSKIQKKSKFPICIVLHSDRCDVDESLKY